MIKNNELIISLLLALNLSSNCFANETGSDYLIDKNYNANINLVEEIETILLFNDQERENLALLANQKNSDNKITPSKIDLKITRASSPINLDLKTREKIAYNNYLSGQYEASIELYKQIIEVEPENNPAKYSLALIYQQIGQFHQAKNLYRELLKNNVKNREEIIGNLLSIMAQESPKDAIYLIRRLSDQHPDSSYLASQMALIYVDLKNYEQAAIYMEKAVENDPKRVDYIYNLAIIYDKAKNYDKALEAYFSVLRNYNQSEKWKKTISDKQVKSRIESIRNL